MHNKFALCNFQGEAKQFYLVDTQVVRNDHIVLKTAPSHHIFVVDASGSMIEDMAEMKAMIEKLFVLEEYHDADTLFSLLSYASEGDLIVHFSRVKVSQLNQANSQELQAVKALETRGATCMSQALEQALSLVQEDELTCISLHSDGYANDSSVHSEYSRLDELISKVEQYDHVFVNTFAYRSNADFKLLSKIANSLSGRCLQADHIKDIFDALRNSTNTLVKTQSHTYFSSIDDYDFQVFVSKEAQRINGTDGDLKVRGVPADAEQLIYRYKEISEADYQASSAPECGLAQEGLKAVAAFAKAQLTLGQLNMAKYALVSMKAPKLLERHAKALTNEQILYFSNTLEQIAFNDLPSDEARSQSFGFDTSAASLMSILQLLGRHASHVKVDLKALLQNYQRASIHRVEGTRDEEGKLIEPWLDTKVIGDADRAQLLSIAINRNDAEVDLNLAQEVELINRESQDSITEVEGIDLKGKLKTIRSYKLVTGGILSVPSLSLKLESKLAHRQLVELGVLEGEYKPKELYTINLSHRPLVDYGFKLDGLKEAFDRLCRYKILRSMFNALLKNTSIDYTTEQLKALQEHYITPLLNLSMPTTPVFADLDQAITEGLVDARTVYKIDVGSTSILNLSKFKSANAYLARRFKIFINQSEAEKPGLNLWWSQGFKASIKSLSARTKLDETDAIMMPLFEDFLELGSEGVICDILKEAGADDELLAQFKAFQARTLSDDDAELVLYRLKSLIKRSAKQLYEQVICPLVFYIGATGVLPDMIDCEIMDSETVEARYPSLKIVKADREKTFYQLGDSLISVYPQSEYFSVRS